jgi:hypothetical protein
MLKMSSDTQSTPALTLTPTDVDNEQQKQLPQDLNLTLTDVHNE